MIPLFELTFNSNRFDLSKMLWNSPIVQMGSPKIYCMLVDTSAFVYVKFAETSNQRFSYFIYQDLEPSLYNRQAESKIIMAYKMYVNK